MASPLCRLKYASYQDVGGQNKEGDCEIDLIATTQIDDCNRRVVSGTNSQEPSLHCRLFELIMAENQWGGLDSTKIANRLCTELVPSF